MPGAFVTNLGKSRGGRGVHFQAGPIPNGWPKKVMKVDGSHVPCVQQSCCLERKTASDIVESVRSEAHPVKSSSRMLEL